MVGSLVKKKMTVAKDETIEVVAEPFGNGAYWLYKKDRPDKYFLDLGNRGVIARDKESLELNKHGRITILNPKSQLVSFDKDARHFIKVGKRRFLKLVTKPQDKLKFLEEFFFGDNNQEELPDL